MGRHGGNAALDRLCDAVDEAINVFRRRAVDERMVRFGLDALAEHHLDPADGVEQLVGIAKEAAAVTELSG